MGLKIMFTTAAATAALATAQMTNTTSAAVASSTASAGMCPPGYSVCMVSDPTRKEAPWAGSSGAYPQCYSPSAYTCSFQFLCPVGTTKLPGLYACSAFGSNGTAAGNGSASTEMLRMTVNAPSVGDVDGVMAQDFIVDLTLDALSMSANSIIPQMPLYQDMKDSTFGPGPNAAFPGLVVLQNTTSMMLGGPNTNLAGVFQLNGLAQRNGLNQYNSVWQAGGPLFGVGPSELVVYYVSGKAGMNATYLPTSGLLSNIVRVPFTISNRTANTVPSSSPSCYNGDVYTAPMNASATPAQITVPYPVAGDVVGKGGKGWMMDVAMTASSSMYNSKLSTTNGYMSGYNAPNSSTFGPGMSAFLPGLVVTLNTTMDMGPFSGPDTNLAGLFQANVARVKDCDTLIQIWASWFVGMAIAGHGPVQATTYFVDGDAPDVVNASTPMNALTPVATVDFMLS